MKYYIFILILFLGFAHAQVVNKTDSNRIKTQDSLVIDSGKKDSLKIFRPTIQDYKFFTQFSEKQVIDTAFTYDKTYVFSQYNNTDNFGKIQFANIGSGFNTLMYEANTEQNLAILPINKSFGISPITDIKYYDVKTPTTTFIYHNAVKNGAALYSTYTQNIGKNFNFAVEYTGIRSQGQFSNSLASNNKTLFSAHFTSKNSKYKAFAHYIHQNVSNQEFGGISNNEFYINAVPAYDNRANVEVNLVGSNSRLAYRRYYFSHQFTPFNPDKIPFKLMHTIFHQGNKYYFGQSSLQDYFYDNASEIISGFPISTGKYSKNLSNTVSAVFDNSKFKLDAGVRYQMISAGVFDGVTINAVTIPDEIKESRFGAVGNLNIKLWNKVELTSNLEFSKGEKFGDYLRSANLLRFEPIKDYFVNAKVNFQSSAPSFNYFFNSSPYKKFNYYFTDFKNQNSTEIGGNINLKWFKTQLFANYFRIDNFTYFDENALPKQSDDAVNISQFGGESTFNYGKFHLNTKLLFQNTLSNKDLFPAPNFIGRANVFYQTKAFKNAAEIQTGIKTYYFTKFNSRNFSPILNEFILPNSDTFAVGGRPIFDAYFNMKVKRMFFFVEGQQLSTFIKKNTLYTAPDYPYHDFRLNIGIVWYLIN